jgi:hypothetical protein
MTTKIDTLNAGYQLAGDIARATAAVVAAMPAPTQAELRSTNQSEIKDQLISVYGERFSMIFLEVKRQVEDYLQQE